MTLRVYIPKVADRVRVRDETLARLGVPRAVGGSGATVVALDADTGKPIVRLDAVPWATPAAAYVPEDGAETTFRSDGFELLPRDIWPSSWLPPSEVEAELLDVFWTAVFAVTPPGRRLDLELLDSEKGAAYFVALLADHCAELRQRVARLERGSHAPQDVEEPAATEEPDEELSSSQGSPRGPDDAFEAELDRTVAEAGLPTFNVSAPMPPVKPARKGGPGDSIRDRHRKGGPFDESDGVDDLDFPPPEPADDEDRRVSRYSPNDEGEY